MLGSLAKILFSGSRPKDDECRRESREQVAFGSLQIGDATYPLKNWSTTGFLATSYGGAEQEGDRVYIRLSVQLPGRTFDMACKGIVVRVDREAREVAGVFVNVRTEDRVTLDRYFSSL
ncbi:MAG: hypothetical protein WCF16_04225 [Alphaproteobacteria bacterium]